MQSLTACHSMCFFESFITNACAATTREADVSSLLVKGPLFSLCKSVCQPGCIRDDNYGDGIGIFFLFLSVIIFFGLFYFVPQGIPMWSEI